MGTKNATAIDTIARECIAVRLRLVNRVITNVYDDALRGVGLKVSQMNILVVATRLKVARPADVCENLQMDTSTLSRNVERMRAKGWIETVVDSGDARAQPFRVTAAGAKLLEQAVPVWKQAQKQATELLGADGVALLGRVAESIGLTNQPQS